FRLVLVLKAPGSHDREWFSTLPVRKSYGKFGLALPILEFLFDFVAAVDGEVANGHVCGSADQNLGCDWIACGQAGSVLHDAAERRHNDRCAQSSALNASEGQRFFDSTYSG